MVLHTLHDAPLHLFIIVRRLLSWELISTAAVLIAVTGEQQQTVERSNGGGYFTFQLGSNFKSVTLWVRYSLLPHHNFDIIQFAQ